MKELSNRVFVVLFTAILGALFGYYFQQRSWNNEKAVAMRERDAGKAFETEQKLAVFIDGRWSSINNIVSVYRSARPVDSTKSDIQAEYKKHFDDWQDHFRELADQVSFYIDAPFELPRGIVLKEINDALPSCDEYALKLVSPKCGVDEPLCSESASHLLQIIGHCNALADKLLSDKRALTNTPSCESKSQSTICKLSRIAQHIWWLNNVLRCTMFERANAIRKSQIQMSTFLMPEMPTTYHKREGSEVDCIRAYRDDPHVGQTPS